MTSDEIAAAEREFSARVHTILTPGERACYDAYQQRLRRAIEQHDISPLIPTPAEQAVLDAIEADTQAAALHKRLLVLLRVETLPQ